MVDINKVVVANTPVQAGLPGLAYQPDQPLLVRLPKTRYKTDTIIHPDNSQWDTSSVYVYRDLVDSSDWARGQEPMK